MTTRIVRVLEYEYETAERATKDWERWAVPPQGCMKKGSTTIRSFCSMPYEVEGSDEPR